MNPVARPAEVTIVAILVWAEGVMYVVAGMIMLINWKNPEIIARAGGANLIIPFAIATFVVSLVFLGASGGILRGSNGARILISLLMLVSIGIAVYIITGGTRALGGALIALLAIVSLALLWMPRASRYFGFGFGRRPAVDHERLRP